MFEYNGLTSEEYADVLAMCVNWYNVETTLFAGADKDDRLKSAYYNICTLDPYDLVRMMSVLKSTNESRSLIRLRSIFFAVKIRLGDKKIKRLTKSFKKEIIKHPSVNFDKLHMDALFKRHPYVILIPLLTFILMKEQSTIGIKSF